MSFRNIAIIAHVDHGKTTLVDAMLRQCNVFAAHEAVDDRVMDSMDLERERGITIASKNTAVFYGDTKINILDTPGHADFGGEVERVLSMVEGAILLVDASEGPLPQTRFVLRKAMEAGLTILVCLNKIDRGDARPAEVLDEVYDLFIDLGADEHQLEFPVLYAVARDGRAMTALDDPSDSLKPLLDAIVEHVPPPKPSPVPIDGPQVLVTNLAYDSYVGRLAIGRLFNAPLKRNQAVVHFHAEGQRNTRPQLVYTWRGLKRIEVTEAEPGDIVAIAGVEDITVGDTVAGGEAPLALPRVRVDEPTIGMTFTINSSPLSGRDGKQLTARQIRDRLDRELLSNVSLRVEETASREAFKVFGRGELQLAILVEQMRREGFELTLSRPEVVKKETDDGRTLEPYEQVVMDVPEEHTGAITQRMADRRGSMVDLANDGAGRTRITYRIPARGLIGFRSEFLTLTRGLGVINALFDGWDEDVGAMLHRANGALAADRTGKATAYAIYNLQPRGEMFVKPGDEVYEGMVVGEHIRENDLNVDITKAKQLTNFRSAGADEKLVLVPPRQITLERAMDFIDEDELIEVTPTAIRIRKRVLATNQRSVKRGA
ncbi:MAG: translational GTPase TypA [Alphaproteobacteria bacterium]|nr:translational GTPase TypA [Alphaproteobacteria bacterium]